MRLLLVVTGVLLVGYLIVRIGPDAIWNAFHSLSWGLLLILVFPTGLVAIADTLAWHFAFPKPPRSFARLLGVRLAGDALNLATPTASVGGDVFKAFLLRPAVSLSDGMASVIADKTTGVVSQMVALVAGLAILLVILPDEKSLVYATAAAAVIEVLCVAGFIAAQVRGAIGGGGRLMAKLRLSPGAERQAALDGMDHALRTLYTERRRSLAASMFWHLVGFALGTIEIYIVVRLLGLSISLPAAFTIGAIGTAIKFFTFMVPASLGALEGGNIAVFAAFGLGGTVGLTYTLVRRLREIVWIGVGFVAWYLVSLGPPPVDVD